MRTARSLPYRGVFLTEEGLLWYRDPPKQRPPRQRSPRQRPLPVNRITDRCKNITFQQLRLGLVIKKIWQNFEIDMDISFRRPGGLKSEELFYK